MNISRSKSEEPEANATEPSTGASKVTFKLGHSKRASPVGVTSMQVVFVRNFLSRSDALSSLLYRSGSLLSGLTSTGNHQLMSRSTSCRKCPLFHKSVPTKYERRVVRLTLADRPLHRQYHWKVHSFVHNLCVIYSVDTSLRTRSSSLINDTCPCFIVRHRPDFQGQCNIDWGPFLFQLHMGTFDFVPVNLSNHVLCANAPTRGARELTLQN
jgi:hypothetical protein